jgi:hypothetical protein
MKKVEIKAMRLSNSDAADNAAASLSKPRHASWRRRPTATPDAERSAAYPTDNSCYVVDI